LKGIYPAAEEGAAREALEAFERTWEGKYPMIYRSGDDRRNDLGE
jgi:transposase-like protein